MIELRSDWILAELEPEPPPEGIVRVGPEPVRVARVLQTGPGRRTRRGTLIPMDVRVGERVPFFAAAADTAAGRALRARLSEHQVLLRESDILFVLESGALRVSL